MSSTILRIVGWAIAFLIGAFYGTAGTVGQAFLVGPVPVGLILATVGSAALLVALRTLTGDRINALAGGLGITAATYLFSQVGPGGSAIVAAPTAGTVTFTGTQSRSGSGKPSSAASRAAAHQRRASASS